MKDELVRAWRDAKARAKEVAENSKTREDFLGCFDELNELLGEVDEQVLGSARYFVVLSLDEALDIELIEASLAYIGVFRWDALPAGSYVFFPEIGGPSLEDLKGKISRQVERITMGAEWGPLLVVQGAEVGFVPVQGD